MEEMQEKLVEFRVRKRRKERVDELKSKFRRFLMLGTGKNETGTQKLETAITINEKSEIRNSNEVDSDVSSSGDIDLLLSTDDELEAKQDKIKASSPELEKENRIFKYTLWTVYLLFWTTLYIIAIELKFGLVFLLFSALFGIYFNTRTGPKKRNEISAYSVFNKNLKSIDGTLKAEQFEREIRFGAGSVK